MCVCMRARARVCEIYTFFSSPPSVSSSHTVKLRSWFLTPSAYRRNGNMSRRNEKLKQTLKRSLEEAETSKSRRTGNRRNPPLSTSLWVHRNLFRQLLRDGNLHGSGMSHATRASPKPSFRAPWKVGDAMVGSGNAGWTTSKSGHPCSC